MKSWWYNSSTRQKWLVGGFLLIGVNCFTWFFLSFFSLKIAIFNGICFIWALMLPSDYDD